MNKFLLGKAGLFALAFTILISSHLVVATTSLIAGSNNSAAPVNNLLLNFSWSNSTNITGLGAFNSTVNITFNLPSGLLYVGSGASTNLTSGLNNISSGSNPTIVVFGNTTTNDTADQGGWLSFNVSAVAPGPYSITVNETYNVSGTSNWLFNNTILLNVNQSATLATIYLNDSQVNQTSVYPNSSINATATSNASTLYVQLWRNGTLIHNATSMAWNITQLGVGSQYNFTAQVLGNANYSSSSPISLFWNVTQGGTSVTLYLNGSQVNQTSTYPNSTINATAVSNVSGLSVIMWRNDSLLDNAASPAWNITQWGVGSQYNFTALVIGNANYSNSSITSLYWNVTQGTLSISITGTNSSSYPTSPYVNGTRNSSNIGDADVNYTLWRNGTLASSANGASVSDTTVLKAMIFYMYTFNATGGTNWTSNVGGVNTTVNVTKGTPTLMLNISPSTSVTNPTQTNATGYNCPSIPGASDVNCTLWRNSVYVESDIAKNMSDVSTRDTGNWVYNFSTEGGANWTSNYTTLTLTVSAAASSFVSGGGGGYSSPVTKVTVTRGNAAITVPSIAAQSMASVTIAKMDDVAFRQINISVANSVNNIKIVITKLPGLPASVTHGITGKVYNYIEVDETNFTNADVSNVYIKFAVNKTWLTDNGVDASDISLYRWANNQWNELATTYVSSDSYEAFYQVQSPGMSFFLIGTKGGEATAVVTTCTESWTCGAWSDCANSVQTRACTDANNCGTTINKPAVSQSCVLGPVAAVDYTWLYAAGIIIILIIAAVVLSKVTKPSSKK